jgi:hypothetical protein
MIKKGRFIGNFPIINEAILAVLEKDKMIIFREKNEHINRIFYLIT